MSSKRPQASDMGLDPARLPRHVAMIMDGNGRWAKKRLLNRVKGHEKGVETVRVMVRTSREAGIGYLTLYAFSTENWSRPSPEVAGLMALLRRFLRRELPEMMENGIRLSAIGSTARLPEDVRDLLEHTKAQTARNKDMVLTLGLSYGSREEIVTAARRVAEQCRQGTLAPEDITEEVLAGHLHTADMPDPDMLIRTSGETRISNFLLWQIAYSELFFTPTLWPDFSRDEYIALLKEYGRRERRFGGLID